MAFIVIAVICGMVIGHALVSQAMPAPWMRAVSVVPGSVFPTMPEPPVAGEVYQQVAPGSPAPSVVVVAAGSVGSAHVGARPSVTGARVAKHGLGRGHLAVRPAKPGRGTHGHGKHGHGKHGHKHGHRHASAATLSVRWR